MDIVNRQTDVPEESVKDVVAEFNAAGFDATTEKQPDGKYTITRTIRLGNDSSEDDAALGAEPSSTEPPRPKRQQVKSEPEQQSARDREAVRNFTEDEDAHLRRELTRRRTALATNVGYSSDEAAGKDHLNIEPDVETLASVVMAKDWTPPLSIGLFGDWGTGKSFFIDKLSDQIGLIASNSKKTENPEDTEFVSDVIQIPFNAWHYLDTTLWASLATRIFEGISEGIFGKPPAGLEDPFDAARRKLYADLKTTNAQLVDARRAERVAEQLKQDAAAALKARENEKQSLTDKVKPLNQLTAEDWQELLHADPQLAKQFEDVAKLLHVDGAQAAVTEVRQFVEEATEAWGRARKVFEWARRSRGSWIIALLGAAVAALFVWAPSEFGVWFRQWVGQLGQWLSGSTALVSGILAALMPHMRRVQRGLTLAEAAQRLADKAANREFLVQSAKLTQAERHAQQAQQAVSGALKEIETIKIQIEDIQSGRAMESFLHERVSSADYAQRRGIIAIVREDLLALKKRLNVGVQVEKAGGKRELVKIDRVVLYIDDLDRCPPKRVVDVLQAVHLLLAIDLFVVVVAADPRWLLNALRWHYQELFNSDTGELELPEEESAWMSTPHNYVEKIFQIPFTLRSMDLGGYAKLVEGAFTANAAPEPSASIGDLPRLPASSDTKPQTPNLKPEGLEVTNRERELLGQLWPIVATPRSTKRLINVYRLIKAQLSDKDRPRFMGQADGPAEFVAVQILLAILVGYPALAPDVFRSLRRSKRSQFWKFVEELKPKTVGESFTNAAREKLSDFDVDAWNRFCDTLEDWRVRINNRRDMALRQTLENASNMEPFQIWVDEVARYSFRAGHVVSALRRR